MNMSGSFKPCFFARQLIACGLVLVALLFTGMFVRSNTETSIPLWTDTGIRLFLVGTAPATWDDSGSELFWDGDGVDAAPHRGKAGEDLSNYEEDQHKEEQ